MATDLIRYDLLVQDALRGVVREVLTETARNGLQGEHHFFITFRTKAPGLRLSSRMREQYPEEMTIILQHQFWDLSVSDQAFEVGLSFNKNPERLLVPFDAIASFVDPSVQFALKFDAAGQDEADDADAAADEGSAPSSNRSSAVTALAPVAEKKSRSQDGVVTLKPHDIKPATPAIKPVPAGKATPAKPVLAKDAGKLAASDKTEGEPSKADEAKIVSIDAFRKKP